MFGTYLGIGSSLLVPAAAAHGGAAARAHPGRPSLSLALSGALHGAALALFLAVHGSQAPEPPGIEIRVWTKPSPVVLPSVIPPAVARGGGRSDERGVPEPRSDVDPDLEVTAELPDVGGPVREGPRGRADPGVHANGAGELPPPTPADPDMPSLYEEPPMAIFAPEPEYPDLAREAGIEGRLIVEALVGRDGRVRETRVRGANPILEEAARKAIERWKFKPAQWNRQPVTAWVSIPVVFRLH